MFKITCLLVHQFLKTFLKYILILILTAVSWLRIVHFLKNFKLLDEKVEKEKNISMKRFLRELRKTVKM